jgi:hypothetical protein
LQGIPVEIFPCRGAAKEGGKAHAEIGFLQHVEETGHGPSPGNFLFQGNQVGGFRLRRQRGELDPPTRFFQDADLGIFRHMAIKGC